MGYVYKKFGINLTKQKGRIAVISLFGKITKYFGKLLFFVELASLIIIVISKFYHL